MGQPSKERERDGGRVLGTLREEAAPASLHGHVSRVEPKQTCAVVRPAQLTVTSAGGGRCPVLPFIRAEFSGRVRFWGPYDVDDGAILLAAIELNCAAVEWADYAYGPRLQAVGSGADLIGVGEKEHKLHLCPHLLLAKSSPQR